MKRDPLIDLAWILTAVLAAVLGAALLVGSASADDTATLPAPAPIFRRVDLDRYPPGTRLIVHWVRDGKEDKSKDIDVLTTGAHGTQTFVSGGVTLFTRLDFLVLDKETGKRTLVTGEINPYVVDVYVAEAADYEFEYFIDGNRSRKYRIWDLRTSDIAAELQRRMSTDTLWLRGDPFDGSTWGLAITPDEAAKVNAVAWRRIRGTDEEVAAGLVVEIPRP